MINADTVSEGLHTIMYDNVTEYGQTINTLKRFNLYPEVHISSKVALLLLGDLNFQESFPALRKLNSFCLPPCALKGESKVIFGFVCWGFVDVCLSLQVVIGILYRWFESATAALDYKTKMCWHVNRGDGLSPVQICEGTEMPRFPPPEKRRLPKTERTGVLKSWF